MSSLSKRIADVFDGLGATGPTWQPSEQQVNSFGHSKHRTSAVWRGCAPASMKNGSGAHGLHATEDRPASMSATDPYYHACMLI